MRLLVIGGHGKVALHLARLASKAGHNVTSVIRDAAQSRDITDTGASPAVISLEDAPVSDFTKLITDTRAEVVYFSAGAGGKGGEERTKAVDYAGAVKTFDAIDAVTGINKPRLVLVSGLDVGNEDRFPDHYREDVAAALLHLASVPSKAAGLAIDMAGGDNPIAPAIDAFVERGVTDWLGQV
ncbi:hypothetical protein FRC07_009532 [Ceratobasidium sp. 392]|nr:hypothetical protein FRC07_009532 [Ceratobasidium sp. 392]